MGQDSGSGIEDQFLVLIIRPPITIMPGRRTPEHSHSPRVPFISIAPRCLRPDLTAGRNTKRLPVFQAHCVSFSSFLVPIPDSLPISVPSFCPARMASGTGRRYQSFFSISPSISEVVPVMQKLQRGRHNGAHELKRALRKSCPKGPDGDMEYRVPLKRDGGVRRLLEALVMQRSFAARLRFPESNLQVITTLN